MTSHQYHIMEELCAKSVEDDVELQTKIDRFITDRSIDTVTGIRRMGRENLVSYIAERCMLLGYECSVYPDVSKDIVIFKEWHGYAERMKELKGSKDSVDILYGQDLCHQVPAIVRFR